MKRIPQLLTLLTAIFLIICFFEIRGRGMGLVPPISDWELHPGVWWHSNFLADCGELLIELPSLVMILLMAPILPAVNIHDPHSTPVLLLAFGYFSIGFPIAIESLFVFIISISNLCRNFTIPQRQAM